MSEEVLWYAVVLLSVLVAVWSVPMAIWVIVTRPPWWKLKDAIYYSLYGSVLTVAWPVFMGLTAPMLSHWQRAVLGIGSFILVLWLGHLAKEKFNQ
jgi:hypothetical protein